MIPIVIPHGPERTPPPSGKHALFLEKLIILGRMESKIAGWKPAVKSVFEFQYVRERREDADGAPLPIRISRTLYGSRKLEAFLEDLILDFPEARTKAGIDASAIVGRVFNTLITETTKNGRPVADVSRILQSVPPEIFEKKGIVMLNAPVFFSIYQNVETGKPYQSAAEVISSGSFLSLSNWQKEAVGESLDFARLAGADNYDLRRDENGAINLEPKTPPAVPAAPAEPVAGDLPWDGNLDGEELPF